MLDLPIIPDLDEEARRRAWARLDDLTKPERSLGRLEEIAGARDPDGAPPRR